MKYDVVALGELLIDFTMLSKDEDGYPTMAAHPGGAPANFLAAIAKFGGKTALLGKIGADAFGKLLLTSLDGAGIDTKGLLISDEVFTTLAFVTIDNYGDREFSFARKPGADTQIHFDELDLSIIDDAKIFHFGTLSLTDSPSRETTRQALAYARAKGKTITFDPNLRKPLWDDLDRAKEEILWGLSNADIVKISDEEVEFLFGLDAQKGAEHILREYDVKLVFITCGSEGCWYQNAICSGHVACPEEITSVDTTGAGDIFGGSAIWKILQIGRIPEALSDIELRDITTFACTAASLSTTKHGGISSVPNASEICLRL